MVQKELKGIIFDVQGFSVHDGPGCRTLIFLKGCSLRCRWCSNPEGIHPLPEPLYDESKCIGDLLCVKACSARAITIDEDKIEINKNICSHCIGNICATACNTSALRIAGYPVTIGELFQTISRDRQYWGGNGGITLTGGEPFLQPEFASGLLKKCYESYIHTAVETCGNVSWTNIIPSLSYLDWIFFDLKHLDTECHREYTGHGNEQIMDNARRLASEFNGRLIFRLPLIPGFNNGDEHILQLAAFLNSIGKHEINVLPLHHLGREKYKLLFSSYFFNDSKVPEKDELMHVQQLFQDNHIHCYIGSSTPF